MATYTPNLNLEKPAGTDAVNIAVLNANMDKLDNLAVLSGAAAPTTSTVGVVGQFYLETTTMRRRKRWRLYLGFGIIRIVVHPVQSRSRR
jgi:hypothetical protein